MTDEGLGRASQAASRPASPPLPAADVVVSGASLSYGRRRVLAEVSCSFPAGAITVVLGGSGSGKSTLLKLLGGLLQADAGSVRVAGVELAGLRERELYEVRRRLGMMFQNGALLDSLSVFDNLALPLREHSSLGAEAIADRVHESLAAVGLADVDELKPRELSGGMVKRVALARALMGGPDILLVDEPFSGLDPLSTRLIESLLVRINRERGMTMIVVSHHIASTMRMADQVLLLLPDAAVQGSPAELKASPDPRVRRFLADESETDAEVLAAAADLERHAHAHSGADAPGGAR